MKPIHIKPLLGGPDRYVGAVVRDMRKQRRLKQSELAERLGMTGSNLSRLEDGKFALRLRDLPKIAEVLGIATRDLIPPWYLTGG